MLYSATLFPLPRPEQAALAGAAGPNAEASCVGRLWTVGDAFAGASATLVVTGALLVVTMFASSKQAASTGDVRCLEQNPAVDLLHNGPPVARANNESMFWQLKQDSLKHVEVVAADVKRRLEPKPLRSLVGTLLSQIFLRDARWYLCLLFAGHWLPSIEEGRARP